jgi:SM-20-related protein
VNEIIEKIIDAIAERGWYVGSSIFETDLTHALRVRAIQLRDENRLSHAKIGRGQTRAQDDGIRSDRTAWLDATPTDALECAAVASVNALRERMNATLFLGARSCELHFAHYAPGTFYKTHRDRFADESARVISLVFYLNDDWPEDAGGELVLYNEAMNELARVLPRAGTMIAFRSELFPHEVSPATRDRFSLTGWLRSGSTM